MQKRVLGDTGVAISPIVLGTWAIGGWMWGGTDEALAMEAIKTSIDLGVTTIDTAPVYGMGLSERLIGRAIKGQRHRIQIATKCGLRWDVTAGEPFFQSHDSSGKNIMLYRYSAPESIIWECEQSLERLGVDYIDLYQIHWPDASTPVEESWRAMTQLLEQGKVRAIGLSNFSLEDQRRMSLISPIASHQLPYSAMRRGIEKDLLPYCRAHHVSVLAYSPLERGLLTGTVTTDRVFPIDDHRRSSERFSYESRKGVLEVCRQLTPLAEQYGLTVAQLFINWTVCQPGITAAIVGARNAAHAYQNAQALQATLSLADLEAISAAFTYAIVN